PDSRAEDIFARTRVAFAARAYPSTIKYGIRISGFRNGAWAGRTYDAFEQWPERSVVARSISEEEAANPYKPSMFAKSILQNFGPPSAQSGGPQGPHILGFPELAVSYAFGLTPRTTLTTAPAATDAGLRTIGTVRAVARTYDVRLAGEESIDGSACWHLTLRPLGNPGTYRVRDLWVDERSYQTRKLVTDGNFTRKETGSGLWTVSYVQSGDAWYLASEISQGPVNDDLRYDHVAVQFVGVTADPHEPLDFGLAGSSENDLVVEPDDPLPKR
ncbi:MAG: hypothetical protein IAI50_19875, partial [Candidatus Eremiobacteraeota bacterium]|nr:hypothetical protein [Candidatus Eremiobacteraeota bacterium]